MRSALISRSRVKEAWLLMVVICITLFSGVIVGYMLGKMSQPRGYTCPKVDGAKTISTFSSRNGQFCVYERESFASEKMKVKL